MRSDVFVIDVNKFKPGDVVLSTNSASRVSQVIRKVTDSNFSHASIAMMGSNCVEAVGNGVRVMCLERIHVVDLNNVRVLRLKASFDADVPTKAASAAKGCLFRPYWPRGAMAAGLGLARDKRNEDRFFCSHLVAHCYIEAGIDIFGREIPEAIVPGDFLRLTTFFDDVTDSAFRAIPKKYAPALALDIEGYPGDSENAFAALNQNISRNLDSEFKTEEWFRPFRNKLHQFSEWYGLYFYFQDLEVLRKYDAGLVKSFNKYDFSNFLRSEMSRNHPLMFVTIEQWAQLLDTAPVSQKDLVALIELLKASEASFQQNTDIYISDLEKAKWLMSLKPKLIDYEGVRVLQGFYKERLAIARECIKITSEKIGLLTARLC